MQALVMGMKVRYLPQPEWGVGHLLALEEGGNKAVVEFPAREGGPVLVSSRGGALVPHQLQKGDEVLIRSRHAVISGEVEGGRGLRRYEVRYDDNTEGEWPEGELRAVPPRPDMLSMLKECRVAEAKSFLLRRSALQLDDERRCDALGALLASRVMVKPHQVGVVQRVLSARRPRFVLADEVGLGKTIEAGMIFSALRLAGLANRVLVVTPSHLSVQWLAELFHKFNQLFTLLDGDRYELSLKERPDVSPWARFNRVVTSLELLQRSEAHRTEAADRAAFWDLVIIDEAHHLKAEKAFEAAAALAKNAWGLLLLTATPMQLDPSEYHALLRLIDPETAPTLQGFGERLARQEELSAAVRGLLGEREGKKKAKPAEAVKALAARFPEDRKLKALKEPSALLSHLAETYSLSDRLIRNRRARVGGFSSRRLQRHPVTLAPAELAARAQALEVLRTQGGAGGAVLSRLLRQLESSPAAFLQAARGNKALAGALGGVKLAPRDGKYRAFVALLSELWKKERSAKVLVFTESRDTLESLQQLLRGESEPIEALAYHGDLALVERDRQVARFRDPEGPKLLLCTEVGGEGRNFQFSHHLVNYDLPWSPAVMEQRIGRLDRIGQSQPVEVHVFQVEGTLSADVLELLDGAVGVFGETVGGLDAVLEEVEGRLSELALAPAKQRAAYAAELTSRVKQAREQVRRAYDPLLDLRSFDAQAVEELVQRAFVRLGVEAEEPDAGASQPQRIEDGLWTLARDLDERLEETVTELARKVGIGVDTDEQVEAFHCALHFGHALNVEALPGIDIAEEKTVLGTFWRDTAVEREEIDYLATGHPVVEALFGFLRDGPYGRNGARYLERRGPGRWRGLELLFHLHPPEAADTSPGALVPSRQLARFLDRLLVPVVVVEGPDGRPKLDHSLAETLTQEGRPLKGDELRAAFPTIARFVDPAVQMATAAAEVEMKARSAAARKAIEQERDLVLERLQLSLSHQGLSAKAVGAQLSAEKAHYASLVAALDGVFVKLDSVCAFAVNR